MENSTFANDKVRGRAGVPRPYNGNPITDGYNLSGMVQVSFWDVSYNYVSQGIITYSNTLNYDRVNEFATKAGVAVTTFLMMLGKAALEAAQEAAYAL